MGCFSVLSGVNTQRSFQPNNLVSTFNIAFAVNAPWMIFMQNLVWAVLAPFIFLCTLGPLISLVSTLKMQDLPLAGNLASLSVLLLMCFGMSLSMLRGIGRAIWANRTWEWIRTPKYADLQSKQDWQKSKYQIPLDSLWIWESVFVLLGLWAIESAIQHENFASIMFLVPFTVSYAFVLLFSILQSRKTKA